MIRRSVTDFANRQQEISREAEHRTECAAISAELKKMRGNIPASTKERNLLKAKIRDKTRFLIKHQSLLQRLLKSKEQMKSQRDNWWFLNAIYPKE